MMEQKSENMIGRVVCALFLLLVISLGFMKPGIDASVATLTPTDLVFPVLFLVWILAIAARRVSFVWHPAYVAFAVYFFALALSAVFSSQPRLSFAKLAGEGYLMLLPVVVVSVVTSADRLKVTLYAWIAGAGAPILIGLVGIVLYYFSPDTGLLREITYHYGSVPVGNFPRVSSTFVSASMFCNYLTVTLAAVAACRWQNWIRPRTAGAMVAALVLCMAFTFSIAIGGFILAGGLIAWAVIPERLARWFGLSLGLVSAIVFLLISPFTLGVAPTSSLSIVIPIGALNPSSRMLVWSDSVNRFLENPLIGSGVGTPVASVTFQNTDGSWSILTDAHNMFLNVAGQAGIVGLLALILLVIVVLPIPYRNRRDSLHPARLAFGAAFVAAFVYDGLTGSFENARHLWVLIGMILAVDRMAAAPHSQPNWER